MRERWNLIQSRIPRNEVKLRNSRLYVKNKLHGSVVDSSFVLASDHGSTDQSVSDATVSDSAVHLLSATQTQSTFVTQSPQSLIPLSLCMLRHRIPQTLIFLLRLQFMFPCLLPLHVTL